MALIDLDWDWYEPEKEATIVGTAASAEDPHGGHHTRLVDDQGKDGMWVYEPRDWFFKHSLFVSRHVLAQMRR